MIRTYKRKLILTKAQESKIDSWIGVCRLVYNMCLEIKIRSYKACLGGVHKYALMSQLSGLRKEYSWINDAPAIILEDSIKRVDNAYNSFFKGNGFPKFASKKTYNSIQFRQDFILNKNKIRLTKLGFVKMFKDEEILGVIKTATVKKESTGYFICITCEDAPRRFESESQAIGLDMGLSHFAIDSNGSFIENPKHFKKYEQQLRIENRSLSRKKKGSNSWKKQSKRIALLHLKIRNIRRDFLHKESTKIAKANSTVYMEDLNIRGMVKNRNLSKHILDAGWGLFKTMLEYKTNVIKINPRHTSQTCFECGAVDKKSRINQSEFCCTSCGHVSNADVNAANNILSKGIAISRQRDPLGCALTLKSTIKDMSA